MTKHTDEFSEFTEPMTCREYTLPRDDKSADPKGWIQGNTKLGPLLEVSTSYLRDFHGVEIRIESVNNDNSHYRQEVRRQRAGDLYNEEGSSCDCKPIQGQNKTTKTHFCQLIHKN